MSLFSLRDRIALVTGASRGLGRVIAGALAEAGATVVLAARDRARLEDAAAEIGRSGGSAQVAVFDLTDEAAVAIAVPAIIDRHGRIDILVNNAAFMPRGSLLKSTLADWDGAMNVNLRSAYLLCREAARGMIRQRYGKIVNLSSYVATVGRGRQQAYSASKAGLEGLTRSLACELGPHNITVNAISPGLFLTEMATGLVNNASVMGTYERAIALGRGAQPGEIAGAAVFLASDASSYVTGATLDVDGGVRNVMPMHFGASPS